MLKQSRASLGSDSKESACYAGDLGLIPGSVRSPGEGNGNTLQYFCLGNPMDRGAWWAIESTGSPRVGLDQVTNTSEARELGVCIPALVLAPG